MKHRGMSRIEVVVTLGVTGVLGVALLPALAQQMDAARSREYAQRQQCMSNLKQVVLATLQYTVDWDESYPRTALANRSGAAYGWAEAIQPYTGTLKVMQCPTDRGRPNRNSRRPGYTDYWYNRNFSMASMATVRAPAQTLIYGDGDGSSPQSNARYSLNSLPKAWLWTPKSPARRHRDGGCYAFADGHVKSMKPAAFQKDFSGTRYTFSLSGPH